MKNRKIGLLSISLSMAACLFGGTFSNAKKVLTEEEKIMLGKDLWAMPAEVPVNGIEYTENPTSTEKTNANIFLGHMNFGTTRDYYRGDGVKVAVIDSGVNYNHEDFYNTNGDCVISDLSASILLNASKTSVITKKVSQYGLSILDDTNGHGTNVASTIASQINGKGSLGVAPNVELVILKTNYNFAEIATALNYCINNKIDIVNMSIQSYENDVVYNGKTYEGSGASVTTYLNDYTASCYRNGIAVFAAGGNYATDEPSYPANNTNVLAVGALARDSSTNIASYSNTGSNVDVVGPGSVYVADIGGTAEYTETQGTSFACPAVVGAAALYKQLHPNASPENIYNDLKSTCHDLGDRGVDDVFGYGRVDISAFVKPPVYVQTITPNISSIKVAPGKTVQLSCTVSPYDATNKELVYISENENIATVSNSGLVTGVSEGSTSIFVGAADEGNAEIEIPVTVAELTGEPKTVSKEWTLTSSNTDWTASGNDTYFSQPYGYKANGGTLVTTNSIEDFAKTNKTEIKVSFKCLQNGGSSSRITIYLYDSSGNVLGSEVFTPVNKSSASNTEYCTATFTSNLTNAAKIGMKVTTFGKNILVNGAKYELTYLDSGSTPTTKTLESISLSGNYKKSFTVGESFSYEGLVVTANYSSGNPSTVTGFTVSSPNMTTAGDKTVTVSYTEGGVTKEATYTITVTAQAVTTYTVSYNGNGNTGGSVPTDSNSYNSGATVTVKGNTGNLVKTNYNFTGWNTKADGTGTSYSSENTFSITSNITLYAKWESSGSGSDDSGEYQYYSGNYYSPITNSQISTGGTTLITALKNLIQPKSAFGYANIWTFNENYDKYPSDYDGIDPLTGNAYPTTNNTSKRGKMWDMYSDQTWTGSSQRAGSYNTIGDSYNREHSMPKSWFGGSDSNEPGTDPNHLFNTDGQVNNYRSNYAFGEVVSNITFNGYTFSGKKATGFGILGKNSSGDTVFEPDDAYKGDFARAQMYMATAYYDWNLAQDSNGAKCFSHSDGVSTMKSYYINLLTKWSAEDPVSQKEIDRNNAVYNSTQKNRNPFIDHPTWANKIWGGTPYTWNGKSSDDEPVSVTGVALGQKTASITVGASTTLSYTVSPSNAFNKSVTWSSSDETVATVSNGEVTGVSAGTAVITVTTVDGEYTDTCTVTVESSGSSGGDSNTYKLIKSTADLTVGGKYVIASSSTSTAYLTKAASISNNIPKTDSTYSISSSTIKVDSNVLTFTLGKTGSNYTFKTNNYPGTTQYYLDPTDTTGSNYLKISSTVTSYGQFSISFDGDAAVIKSTGKSSRNIVRFNSSANCFSCYSSGQSPVYLFKQEASSSIPVTGVSLNESSATVVMGSTLTLTATVEPSNATNKNVTWSSSDETIATVLNGIVTPVAVGGPVTITATTEDGNKTATCTVIVNAPAPISVTGVSLNESNVSVSVGSTLTLTATIEPSNATNKNVTWSSSDESVVTVSNGEVTSKAVGNATITVTTIDGGFTANCSIAVTAAPVITYQLEADQETVPYMSGTNHSASVGVKLYKYTNGVKGDSVKTGTANVDTSVLGEQDISIVYNSVTYYGKAKVTNNGAVQGSGTSLKAITYNSTNKLNVSSKETGTVGTNKNQCIKATYDTNDFTMVINLGTSTTQVGNSSYFEIGNDFRIYKGQGVTFSGKGNNLKSVVIGLATSNFSAVSNCTVNSGNGVTTITATDSSEPFSISCTASVQIKSNPVTFNVESFGSLAFTDEQQGAAWSNYFIRLTGGRDFEGPCKLDPNERKAALEEVWSELKSEYNYMYDGSKTECRNSGASGAIAEAMNHYRYIVSKYNLEDFIQPQPVSGLNKILINTESSAFVIGTIAMIGLASVSGYFIYKRRKEE